MLEFNSNHRDINIMNIFYLHPNIETCALLHCDKHVIKMQVEYSQMILTTYNLHGIETPYKSTHINHPSTKWVRQSKHHINYLINLLFLLEKEWQYRYQHNKSHKSVSIVRNIITNFSIELPDIEFIEPPCCMPRELILFDEVYKNYQFYYLQNKKHMLKWTNRQNVMEIFDDYNV